MIWSNKQEILAAAVFFPSKSLKIQTPQKVAKSEKIGHTFSIMRKCLDLRRVTVYVLTSFFLVNILGPLPVAQADEFVLPAPGKMVALSAAFSPIVLKGIKLDPQNPFKFHFFVDRGDKNLSQEEIKNESAKLIKYFLASLTTPEKDLWVNLSPYEKDRIVPQEFGQTEMGRDLLAQDYLLKQITASLIYPESQLGKDFWQKVYAQAQAKYGTTNIPINTFNKVWIVPEKAVVYENGGTAFVLENHLKVMLEEDYLSLQKHQRQPGDMTSVVSPSMLPSDQGLNLKAPQVNNGLTSENTNVLGSQIVREIVIPALTKEVNEGKNFSQLRQVFYSLILATWYKNKIKDSILNKVYSDQNKISGVSVSAEEKKKIYQEYLKAFKKGVFNYIKEEPDSMTNQIVPRKYFSGGFAFKMSQAMTTVDSAHADKAELAKLAVNPALTRLDGDMALIFDRKKSGDEAMTVITALAIVNNVRDKLSAIEREILQRNAYDSFDDLQQRLDHVLEAFRIAAPHDQRTLFIQRKVESLRTKIEIKIQEAESIFIQPAKRKNELKVIYKFQDTTRIFFTTPNPFKMYEELFSNIYLRLETLLQENSEDLELAFQSSAFQKQVDQSNKFQDYKVSWEELVRVLRFLLERSEVRSLRLHQSFQMISTIRELSERKPEGFTFKDVLNLYKYNSPVTSPELNKAVATLVLNFIAQTTPSLRFEDRAMNTALLPATETARELSALTEFIRSIKRMINEDAFQNIKGCFAINGMLMYYLQDDPRTELAMAYNSLSGPTRQYFLILKTPSGHRYILDAAPEYQRNPPNRDVIVVPLEHAGEVSKLYVGYTMADEIMLAQIANYLHVNLNFRKLELNSQALSRSETVVAINGQPASMAMTGKDGYDNLLRWMYNASHPILSLDDGYYKIGRMDKLERYFKERKLRIDPLTGIIYKMNKKELLELNLIKTNSTNTHALDHAFHDGEAMDAAMNTEHVPLTSIIKSIFDPTVSIGIKETPIDMKGKRIRRFQLEVEGRLIPFSMSRSMDETIGSYYELMFFDKTNNMTEVRQGRENSLQGYGLPLIASIDKKGRLNLKRTKNGRIFLDSVDELMVKPELKRVGKKVLSVLGIQAGLQIAILSVMLLPDKKISTPLEKINPSERPPAAKIMKVPEKPATKEKFQNVEFNKTKGGIDLNPAQMRIQVKKEGEDFKFNFNGAEIDAAQVTGATFTIRQMTPVTNLPQILGLNQGPADKSGQIMLAKA